MSTAGGALLGSVIDSRFDGTISPFAFGVLAYGIVAAVSISTLGLRPSRADTGLGGSTSPPPPSPQRTRRLLSNLSRVLAFPVRIEKNGGRAGHV